MERAEVLDSILDQIVGAVLGAMQQPEMADGVVTLNTLARGVLVILSQDRKLRAIPEIREAIDNRKASPMERAAVIGKVMMGAVLRNSEWQRKHGADMDAKLNELRMLLQSYFEAQEDGRASP